MLVFKSISERYNLPLNVTKSLFEKVIIESFLVNDQITQSIINKSHSTHLLLDCEWLVDDTLISLERTALGDHSWGDPYTISITIERRQL